ncbi:hypothetical protein [Candidatus Microthrix parvicella]|jgi:hypothetical protein|uniref:hypothetical protein n=1 Tax=Candidatus Neomicrothrix parvicella TaxID=41950 RepID=UPI00037089EA|nr:hypothetical protein [Candidatus Microthrix parvicella]MBP7930457.1 hypothetical protein [Acidimicrobiia bacterium]
MSAAEFRQIARDASKQAAALDDLAKRLSSLESKTSAAIKGTATQDDRKMIALVGSSSDSIRSSAAGFRQVAAAAKDVAGELAAQDKQHQKHARKAR